MLCRRGLRRAALLLVALLIWAAPNAVFAQECGAPGSGIPSEIDFSVDGAGNPLNAGDIVDSNTFGGITISVLNNSRNPLNLPLMIFDTQNPTGGDFDLGTPNQDFGGPGVGAAGGLGQPGENNVGLGNALIINEDWDDTDPDDYAGGGIMVFVFDIAVEVRQIQTLDADDASPGVVRVYSDAAGTNLINTFTGQAYGENSYELIDISTTPVLRMEFELTGSGTMDKLVLCGTVDGDGTFGDTVYHDANENKVQDNGEIGLPGVEVYLRNNLGVIIDSVNTDAQGRYDFTSLIGAVYTADVNESTLPAGVYTTGPNPDTTHTLTTSEDYDNADFGYNGGALPVELTSFEVVLDGNNAMLTWETASETNNAGFYVETDPGATGSFRQLGFVEGYGTTEFPQHYQYRLDALEPGRHVFRLKQIDYDGTFEYHPEVEVEVEMAERFLVEPVYPNPFNPEATFRFAVNHQQVVDVALYDLLGRRVETLFAGLSAAGQVQVVSIDGRDLPSGTYLVRVVGKRFIETQTITLLK